MDCNAETWFDAELNNCRFKDELLKKRFRTLIENLWNSIGKPIPLACRDWANTKGAYRFLSNEHIVELVRTCVDRLAGDGSHTIADEMDFVRVKGVHKFEVATKAGKLEQITLDIKYKKIKVLPPIGKKKNTLALP